AGEIESAIGKIAPEKRPRIGHQRKASKAVDDGLGDDRGRRGAKQIAAAMPKGHHARTETGRHRQGIGAVLERDERTRLRRLQEVMAHQPGNRIWPSMTRLLSPPITIVSPLSSHHKSPPRGESCRLWIFFLPKRLAQ